MRFIKSIGLLLMLVGLSLVILDEHARELNIPEILIQNRGIIFTLGFLMGFYVNIKRWFSVEKNRKEAQELKEVFFPKRK